MKEIIIYTDGGCSGNPGPGGWAAVIPAGDEIHTEISGGEALTTNNRMELTAVIKALEYIEKYFTDRKISLQDYKISIYTDSQYVQKGISQWMTNWIRRNWKTSAGKPVKNKDLWIQLKVLNDRLHVEWKWVKGHAGDKWNERCDDLVAVERLKYLN